MEKVVKAFRREGGGKALLPIVLEEDRALLRHLGKLRYTQHQLQGQGKEEVSSSQDLQKATRLCEEQLKRFHNTHTEAIVTYLPQLYHSYHDYRDQWLKAVSGQELTLRRLHAIAARHYALKPLQQPLPRACEEKVEALMQKGSGLARDEAERRVRGEKETLMQLFCLAVDAWKPLCRLAERYVASAATWPSHACPDTLTFMYHVRCTTVALWLWVRIWRSPIGRPRA